MRTPLFAFFCCLPLAAQTPPSRVIGLAAVQTGATCNVLRQDQCAAFSTQCSAVSGPVSASVFAGGSAYDPVRRSLWISEGQTLAELHVATCVPLCPAFPATRVLPNSVVSGLAVSVARRELYQLESQPGAIAYTTYDLRSCPPTVVSSCQQPFSITTEAGGLAYDEVHDQLYTAVSVVNAGSYSSFVMRTTRSSPCTLTCRFVMTCNGSPLGGPITGLAYDGCRSLIHASTPFEIATCQVNVPQLCAVSPVSCCPLGVRSQSWIGIDVEAQAPTSVGQSCASAPCPACPQMALAAASDPALGNATFAADLVSGPSGAVALLLGSIGTCHAPGLPILCGQLHLDATRFFHLGLTALSGTTTCDGHGSFPLPVPLDASLCGAQLCLQSLVVCIGSVTSGLGLTNGMDLTIGG